ncbi:protein phosphatase 1 regulatory subunit 16A [Atheta coriaria]|uniref:protein phosphatase 1 regulatory subunit 16A n=1 Tax=Dalotia coriaria TaxID=877792 RepID=UPI0031F477A1
MEHSELVKDMVITEQMSTQDRLRQAKHRRMQQLKIWQMRERENSRKTTKKSTKRHIVFDESVVLLEAAARNDIDEVRRLLMKGVNPNSSNEDGLTALHQCCIDDNESMLQLLLEYGANVNAEDSEKWTPLHAAATCGHLKLIKILIGRGANLLAVNADGNMPYDICEDDKALDYIESEMARRGVTQQLIDDTRAQTEKRMLDDLQRIAVNGGDLEVPDAQNATPLHIAAANGYMSVVEFLLKNNVNTDVKDKDDWRPAHAAACWGHLEVLELLELNGADLTAKNKHEETPADICEDQEMKDRITELIMEQEHKRAAEAQKRTKVKRTQSSNTRTQSVRRTSLRDKGQTARRDAAEELRFRREAVQGLNTDEQLVQMNGSLQNGITPQVNNNHHAKEPNNERSLVAANMNSLEGLERRAPDGKDDDDDGLVEEVIECKNDKGYNSNGDAKVTVVHVLVTINGTGTLADLKKQRMQMRTSSAPDINSPGSPVSTISDGGDSNTAAAAAAAMAGLLKFTTDEVVGAEKPRKCCVIV